MGGKKARYQGDTTSLQIAFCHPDLGLGGTILFVIFTVFRYQNMYIDTCVLIFQALNDLLWTLQLNWVNEATLSTYILLFMIPIGALRRPSRGIFKF